MVRGPCALTIDRTAFSICTDGLSFIKLCSVVSLVVHTRSRESSRQKSQAKEEIEKLHDGNQEMYRLERRC